jgi:putative oxidoreductase
MGVVAYFQNHFPEGFWPILNTGERAVFYCFTFLYIASRGAARCGTESVSQFALVSTRLTRLRA